MSKYPQNTRYACKANYSDPYSSAMDKDVPMGNMQVVPTTPATAPTTSFAARGT